MAPKEPTAEYDDLDSVLSISGQGFYLQIVISPQELRSLSVVDTAEWNRRTSIRAGEALGNPVFWCRSTEDPTAVTVLVGADDEAWGLSLEIPAATLLGALPGRPR
jgi:hypothetical protein